MNKATTKRFFDETIHKKENMVSERVNAES